MADKPLRVWRLSNPVVIITTRENCALVALAFKTMYSLIMNVYSGHSLLPMTPANIFSRMIDAIDYINASRIDISDTIMPSHRVVESDKIYIGEEAQSLIDNDKESIMVIYDPTETTLPPILTKNI